MIVSKPPPADESRVGPLAESIVLGFYHLLGLKVPREEAVRDIRKIVNGTPAEQTAVVTSLMGRRGEGAAISHTADREDFGQEVRHG